jgi:hypothetical protein
VALFITFLRAVGKHALEAVLGVVFTLGGLTLQLYTWTHPSFAVPYRPWMLWLPGVWLWLLCAFDAWRDEHARANEAERQLTTLRAQDRGIEVKCAEMRFAWDQIPGLPDGVLVALDIASIVNGNTRDAIIATKLAAPLWRIGDFTSYVSMPPLVSTVSIVEAKTEQLRPLINLPAKRGVGPGHFLFFFPFEASMFAFVPPKATPATLDAFAELLIRSEMYLELTDRATGERLPHVPAPGTWSKRVQREARKRPARSAEKTLDAPGKRMT